MKRTLLAVLITALFAAPAAVLAQSTTTKDRPAAKSDTAVKADTKGSKTPDSVITGKIKSGFVKDKIVRSRNYNVDTAGGAVTVRGKARSQAEADRAIEIAKNTQGVVSVKNEIVVSAEKSPSTDKPKRDTRAAGSQEPARRDTRAAGSQEPRDPSAKADTKKAGDMSASTSTSTSTSAKGTAPASKDGSPDALITTKIKAEYAKDKAVSAMNIKVDTNNGVVTLGGTAKSKAEADKAVQLAKAVKDVKSVKNEIKVEPAK